MVIYMLLSGMVRNDEENNRTMRVYDEILERAYTNRDSSAYFRKKVQKEDSYGTESEKTNHLTALHTFYWSIRKFAHAMNTGDYHGAVKEVQRLRSSKGRDFQIASLAYISTHLMEIGLARNIAQKEPPLTAEEYLEPIVMYTERQMEDLPVRLELNSILIQVNK